MPDPKVLEQTAQAASQTPATPVQATTETPKEDLITRASKVALDQANPQEGQTAPQEAINFNVKDFDKITDPVARKLAEDAYKSMQADYTRKTQAVAAERKQIESLRSQLEASGQYTPEKIEQLLANPSFIQAAQEYQRRNTQQTASISSELTQEEFSYLTPEQQKAYVSSQEAKKMASQAIQTVNSMNQAVMAEKEDMSLKSRYANYDPTKVNQIYQDMMQGRVQASREHLWKVLDYDDGIKRAYQLGKQDRQLEMGEKHGASSSQSGFSVTQSSEVPARMPNESGNDYFKRLALRNAANLMKK